MGKLRNYVKWNFKNYNKVMFQKMHDNDDECDTHSNSFCFRIDDDDSYNEIWGCVKAYSESNMIGDFEPTKSYAINIHQDEE